MRVAALSGYGVKGPACFLLETAGRRLLLDLGEGPEARRRPDVSRLGKVDAIVLSHSHGDHVGALDLAPGLGHPTIHCTPMVAEIVRPERFGPLAPLPLSGDTEICGLPVRTGRAGHAPGGVWMRIGGEEGLLYTGDFTAEGLLYPLDAFPPARHVIADCSYGDFDDPITTGQQKIMALARTGPLLLPVPAGGRGLEMAVFAHEAGLDLALDTNHRNLGENLLDHPEILAPAERERLARALGAARTADPADAPRGFVLAGSADLESGMAADLAKSWAGRAGILFTGHVAAGGSAAALLDSGAARFIRWNVHPRLSDILALIDTVRPETLLPAFVAEPRLGALRAILEGRVRLVGPVAERAASPPGHVMALSSKSHKSRPNRLQGDFQ